MSITNLSSVADKLSKATYGAPNKPGADQEIQLFINNLYYPYLSPSIPAPVVRLCPNPASSQINRQGGH